MVLPLTSVVSQAMSSLLWEEEGQLCSDMLTNSDDSNTKVIVPHLG